MSKIYDPQEFYDRFVRRTYDEYLASPLDEVRVMTVIHQMNVMAERTWSFLRDNNREVDKGIKSAADYRRSLVGKECPDFQFVWDVDDGHKHVRLDRGDREVSSAAQTGVRSSGGGIGGPIGGVINAFVIVLDDGTEKQVDGVLRNVIEMWERVLSSSELCPNSKPKPPALPSLTLAKR